MKIMVLFSLNLGICGCIPLAYETVKNAYPVELKENVSSDEALEIIQKVLSEQGYTIHQTYPTMGDAVSASDDDHINYSVNEVSGKTLITLWRFRTEMNSLSWDANVNNSDRENLAPNWRIHQLARKIHSAIKNR